MSAQPVRKRDSNAKSQVLYAENRKPQTFDERMSGILNGRYYMFFSISCLLWVLGGREMYILGDPPLSTDKGVYYLYLVALVQLLLDLMLRSPFEHHYFLGFYFWLDVSVFSVKHGNTSQKVALNRDTYLPFRSLKRVPGLQGGYEDIDDLICPSCIVGLAHTFINERC